MKEDLTVVVGLQERTVSDVEKLGTLQEKVMVSMEGIKDGNEKIYIQVLEV
jgi:hypothetical protein